LTWWFNEVVYNLRTHIIFHFSFGGSLPRIPGLPAMTVERMNQSISFSCIFFVSW
jgi:hypothetical protein